MTYRTIVLAAAGLLLTSCSGGDAAAGGSNASDGQAMSDGASDGGEPASTTGADTGSADTRGGSSAATGSDDSASSDAGDTTGGATTGGGATPWSEATTVLDDLGRIAIGNQVHMVGHLGGNLVHLTSADQGLTWSEPTVLAAAAENFPAMYGGIFSEGDNVYLVTSPGNMAAAPRQLDFRKSTDNGANWTAPIRITTPGQSVYRARVVASGNFVHVVGNGDPVPDGSSLYYRSTTGGDTWETGVLLDQNLGPYGGGQTVAVDGPVVHVGYTDAAAGPGSGAALYIRSTDNGATWSVPVNIGEVSQDSDRQARVQMTAVDGYVFACWQRESVVGGPLPLDRLGYNRSEDDGLTWGTAQVLPEDTMVNRNHQQVWMAPGGGLHLTWRHGNSEADTSPGLPDPRNVDGTGYMYSPDYGATWDPGEIIMYTPGAVHHPFSLTADAGSVHALSTGPDGFQYVFRILE